jgi:hypothetical protein
MVTTTTKTLNYSITKGNQTNSVNATITSTPGFNSNYLGKVPGILKIVELLLAPIALGFIAYLRQEQRPLIQDLIHSANTGKTYLSEMFLVGEVYFLCAHSAILTVLVIILVAYLFHTTSAMIVPKATTLEIVGSFLLALLSLAAGITLIVMTELYKYDPEYPNDYKLLQAPPAIGKTWNEEPLRLAAGAVAILNGFLFIGSFVLARKELAGPKSL